MMYYLPYQWHLCYNDQHFFIFHEPMIKRDIFCYRDSYRTTVG